MKIANQIHRDGLLRLASALGVSVQDVENGRRQAHRIFERKEAFRRCHKALRPRNE